MAPRDTEHPPEDQNRPESHADGAADKTGTDDAGSSSAAESVLRPTANSNSRGATGRAKAKQKGTKGPRIGLPKLKSRKKDKPKTTANVEPLNIPAAPGAGGNGPGVPPGVLSLPVPPPK